MNTSTKKNKVTHTTIRNQSLFCTHCGGEHKLVHLLPMDELSNKTNAFNELHKDCKPVWEQPFVEQSKSITEKMEFWLLYGERGVSSEVIFKTISGKPLDKRNSHPRDPDDFRRCYLLLEAIPEWKPLLYKLSRLSDVWEKLVTNWDKLTEMLLEQMKTKTSNGMYELMKSLGC